MEKMYFHYKEPQVEVLEIYVERGFAGSDADNLGGNTTGSDEE